MPVYPLKCRSCGAEHDYYAPISVGKSSTSCDCGGLRVRVWTIPAIPRSWVPHYNWSVGKFCNTRQDFNDGLRTAEEKQFAATGIEASYVALESGDRAGVSDDTLDATHRRARAEGREQRERSFFY